MRNGWPSRQIDSAVEIRSIIEPSFETMKAMSDTTHPTPYGTARDLPSYREMETMVKGLKVLGWLLPKDKRRELREAQAEMEALFDSIEDFCRVLGPRHWIYHGGLPASEVTEMLADDPEPEVAEQRLIAIQQERLEGPNWSIGLRVDGLNQRWNQLQRARQHYLDGHFDSCALVLVTVMDGFVNDFQPDRRRGLAARDEENEMFAWDSITGHHMGLTNVMPVFLKTFRKRHDDEVFDVHRHGMVHGNLTNYDNPFVAMKAWNMLFAVVDWAKATTEVAKPKKPQPTLGDAVAGLRQRGERKRLEREFEPSVLTVDAPEFDQHEVVVRARTFLEAWQKGQWGRLHDLLPPTIVKNRRPGETAEMLKHRLERLPMHEFQLTSVDFSSIAAADVHGTAAVGETSGAVKMRWCQFGEDGTIDLMATDDSVWRLAVWAPERFVTADGDND